MKERIPDEVYFAELAQRNGEAPLGDWTPTAGFERVDARDEDVHRKDDDRRGVDDRLQLTDLGNAERFARDHGDRFRHIKERRLWLSWDGSRWRRDETGQAERAA
jgi:phage/plasmid-associated DNA primase